MDFLGWLGRGRRAGPGEGNGPAGERGGLRVGLRFGPSFSISSFLSPFLFQTLSKLFEFKLNLNSNPMHPTN